MKIPNKVCSPNFIEYCGFETVRCIKTVKNHDSITVVKLPKWLAALIEKETKQAFYDGGKEKLKQIKGILEI